MKDAKGHGSNPGRASAYLIHRQHNEHLSEINAQHSAELQKFPRGPNGLTPDHVKASPEFRVAKSNFDRSFATLREHNSFMGKNFGPEMKADRDARRTARTKR